MVAFRDTFILLWCLTELRVGGGTDLFRDGNKRMAKVKLLRFDSQDSAEQAKATHILNDVLAQIENK